MKDNLFNKIINLILRKATEEVVKRDITFGAYYDQLYQKLYTIFDYPYIMEMMKAETGGDYAVVNNDGKLWKVPVTLSNDEVSIGDPVEVKIDFPEVKSRGFVFRDASGKLKFTSISSAATLNRSGDIDSRDLFDDMERNFEEYSTDAYLQFYHLGEALKFGEIRGCFRLDNLFITYGDIDESNPLGKVAEKRFAEGKWGVSIGFMPLEAPDRLALTRDVIVDVYRKGFLKEVSVLKESDAASYFTNIMGHKVEDGINRMADRKRVKEVLKEFLGDDSEEYVEKFLEEAAVRERTIADSKMITRENDETGTDLAAEGTADVTVETVVEIDDAMIDQIVVRVVTSIEGKLTAIENRANEANAKLEDMFARFNEVSNEVVRMKDEVKQETADREEDKDNTPAKTNVVVRYRPSVMKLAEENGKADEEEISLAELAKIKRGKKENN